MTSMIQQTANIVQLQGNAKQRAESCTEEGEMKANGAKEKCLSRMTQKERQEHSREERTADQKRVRSTGYRRFGYKSKALPFQPCSLATCTKLGIKVTTESSQM
jgi:hypothetical protein